MNYKWAGLAILFKMLVSHDFNEMFSSACNKNFGLVSFDIVLIIIDKLHKVCISPYGQIIFQWVGQVLGAYILGMLVFSNYLSFNP